MFSCTPTLLLVVSLPTPKLPPLALFVRIVRHQVQRRVMPAAIARHFLFRQFGSRPGDGELRIVRLRIVHPFFHVGGLRGFQLEFLAQRAEVSRHRIDQLLQGAPLDFQIVLRGDLLRADQVDSAPGLRGCR